MMFGFPFHARSTPQLARDLPATHLVARLVPAAPCGWVFFDGSETCMSTGDGTDLIIPGGAFFPKEARRFSSESEARAEATRLNDASLCLDRPWRVKPVAAFEAKRSAFTYAVAPF